MSACTFLHERAWANIIDVTRVNTLVKDRTSKPYDSDINYNFICTKTSVYKDNGCNSSKSL